MHKTRILLVIIGTLSAMSCRGAENAAKPNATEPDRQAAALVLKTRLVRELVEKGRCPGVSGYLRHGSMLSVQVRDECPKDPRSSGLIGNFIVKNGQVYRDGEKNALPMK